MARTEILFDGYFYDVTDFMKKHPGGSIIEYYTKYGEDATHAIQQFHHRSTKRVTAIMSSLKKRPASDGEIQLDAEVLKKNRALSEDFTKLYLELEREGLFMPSYVHGVLRVAELLFLLIVGLTLIQWQNGVAKFMGILSIGFMQGRAGWVHHETGHRSLSGNPKFDRYLHAIVSGFFVGISSTWWIRGHNRHHAMPQRLKHDIDLKTMPFLAYNVKQVENAKDGKGFMIQNQVYLFVLIDAFIGGLVWVAYLNPRYVFKHKLYFELVAMIGHNLIFYFAGFWPSVMINWISATYMFLNFALSHSFLPITTEPTHWVEYAFIHTVDVEQSLLCNWWMGYLNFQIEHHLFPTMPQFRHPLIKDRVKALADKHNLPYTVHTYPEAVRKTFKNLADVAKELKES